MKLSAYLQDKKQTSFEVVRTEFTIAESNREKIAVLHLAKPIPLVQGSQTIPDEGGGDPIRLEAYDVDVVRIYQRDFEADGLEINEDGTGSINTDLRLDVANSGDVWLTSKSFAAFGREKRQERANERRGSLRGRMEERKARKALASETTTKEEGDGKSPEPVGDEKATTGKGNKATTGGAKVTK